MTKVAPEHPESPGDDGDGDPAPDDIRDPLASWGRTARLVAIRLSEGGIVPLLIWLGLRR